LKNEQSFGTDGSTGTSQMAYKRKLAYERLGINPKDVQHVPFLRGELRRIARVIRGVDTGDSPSLPVRPLECLRFSDSEDARKVSRAYLSVPDSYRKLLPAEAFCHAAGVSPYRVLEIIAGAAVRQGAMASAIIAAVTHPRVVKKTVKMALRDKGIRERIVLHKATGFIPASGRIPSLE
jgi:hypothetical protein